MLFKQISQGFLNRGLCFRIWNSVPPSVHRPETASVRQPFLGVDLRLRGQGGQKTANVHLRLQTYRKHHIFTQGQRQQQLKKLEDDPDVSPKPA